MSDCPLGTVQNVVTGAGKPKFAVPVRNATGLAGLVGAQKSSVVRWTANCHHRSLH